MAVSLFKEGRAEAARHQQAEIRPVCPASSSRQVHSTSRIEEKTTYFASRTTPAGCSVPERPARPPLYLIHDPVVGVWSSWFPRSAWNRPRDARRPGWDG